MRGGRGKFSRRAGRAILAGACALACVLATGRDVLAKETVLWAALDFPPFSIRDGLYRGSGSFDGLLELLMARLPDYDHDVVSMTFARREEEIRAGTHLCTPGLFRTAEREPYLVFSRPALIHLDNRVVLNSASGARFGAGPVDLESLLARPDLVAGVISGRSYAPNVDPLLRRHAGARNVVQRPLKSAQMFEMLVSGEIDYTLLFPHEVSYLAKQKGDSARVATLSVVGVPPYIFTHVACTKDAWGAAMIARIDEIILAERDTPAYRALSERWYEDADKLLIRKYYPKLLGAMETGK